MELPTFIYAVSVILLIANSFVFLVMIALFRLGVFRGRPGAPGMIGATGAMGEPASIINYIAALDSVDDLPDDPEHADCYIVDGRFYIYSEVANQYQDAGPTSRL